MTSIVVAAALAAAGGSQPDPGVVPVGFFPGGGESWSGTTTYFGFGRQSPYSPGSEVNYPYRGTFGADGRRLDYRGPFSPSPYDAMPARRTGGVYGVPSAPGAYGTTGVYVGGYSGTGTGGGLFGGGGLFRRR
ncbi:MAG TPA: hypothetical protein VH092_05675 [Urbifossiella sp.]|jgi:hypothetical protein|nr:hypothetical protein [Urbifossiella sp.]